MANREEHRRLYSLLATRYSLFAIRHSADRRGGGDERRRGLLEHHGAGEVGDARETALLAPFFQPIDDRDHAEGLRNVR